MRKIVCFDMDMTLLDHRTFAIPKSAMRGLDGLRAKGHILVIASGRDMDSEFSRHLAELVRPDAIVHSNGQKVTVGEKRIRELFMEPELIQSLLRFADERKICIGSNIGDKGCYVNQEEVIAHEKKVFGDCSREFIDPVNLPDFPLYALAMFGTPEQALEIEEAFPMLKLPLFAGRDGADVIYRKASKAEGIQALLEYYQMGWEDVVAFGDSMNDMEMIEYAGLGIAMGNAIEPLKKVADYVTDPIDQDGVWHGLIHAGIL
ncbi:MAG: Cof-type HAD-IIB family hydrolase [Lachnospiraceae bacterium]|nr:Cof-type HAD-IIB family hydrolase [Lachnospiraceae bacterium]